MFKFPSLALVSSWLSGRILDWRYNQPGFDPSFGNLACLATLMGSGRAEQSVCGWEYIYLFTNPSARVGYDTRSIVKRSLKGLNKEFSFSLTSCLTKAEERSLTYYLPIAGGRIIGFIPFPSVLVKCSQPRSVFELVSPSPFPTTITIISRAPQDDWLYIYIYIYIP